MCPLPEDVSAFYEGYPVHRNKSFLYRCIRRLVMGPAYFDICSAAPGSVLLDYGCGDGWFLESCRGRHIGLLGYEPSASLADSLSARLKLPVYSSLERLVCDFRSKVDVITMHFVLEHLTDLEHAFCSMEELLSPRGICFCTVPNLDSWEAKLFGRKWHGLDPPRHISFPQSRVIQELAKRHGLKLVKARPVPFPNGFAGSFPVVVAGHFNFALYLLALPFGIVLSRVAPSGTTAYLLENTAP